MLNTDASHPLKAVLLQNVQENWPSLTYASRTPTPGECKHAQIEKEALVISWGASKFYYYLAEGDFLIETDYKPLV